MHTSYWTIVRKLRLGDQVQVPAAEIDALGSDRVLAALGHPGSATGGIALLLDLLFSHMENRIDWWMSFLGCHWMDG